MNRPLLVLSTFLLLVFLLIKPGSESARQEGGASWRSLLINMVGDYSAAKRNQEASAVKSSASFTSTSVRKGHQSPSSNLPLKTNSTESDASIAPDGVTEASLNQITVKDQNTGFTYTVPSTTGFQVAAAEVLGEQTSADIADFDESLTPPAPDAPEWAKLRWLEAILVDGINDQEMNGLNQLISSPQGSDITQEILSSATLADASPALLALIEKGLSSTQSARVRMLALHLAKDHYPEIVQRVLTDTDETLRLHAEALLDAGRQGTEFRE